MEIHIDKRADFGAVASYPKTPGIRPIIKQQGLILEQIEMFVVSDPVGIVKNNDAAIGYQIDGT